MERWKKRGRVGGREEESKREEGGELVSARAKQAYIYAPIA